LRFDVVKPAPFSIDRFEITALNQGNDPANVAVFSKRDGLVTILNPEEKIGTVVFSNIRGQVFKNASIEFPVNEFIVPAKEMVFYRILFHDETKASGKLFVK
jgi:protein-disulfide isomerase